MAAPRQPQDRKPRTTRTTATATPATGSGAGVLESETPIVAAICGHEVTVAPVGSWRQSANDAMNEGRFNDWAVKVLDADDAKLWLDLDPTNIEVQAFMRDWAEGMGAEATPAERAHLDALRLRRRR